MQKLLNWSPSTKGIILGLLSSATFGLIPSFSIPLMSHGIEIPTILFYRFLFSTILMLPFCVVKKQSLMVSARQFGVLFLLGVLYAATSVGLIWSYSYIPSGIATTIHFLYPILVVFIMMVILKEKASTTLLVTTLVSFIGVCLLCRSGDKSLNTLGILLALSTVLTYSGYIVGMELFAKQVPSLVATFYVLMFCAAQFGIYACATTGIQPIYHTMDWAYLLFLAFLPTVVSDFALVLAIKLAGSAITAILGVLEPVVATCMGLLLFHEPLTVSSFIGLVLVLTSVVIVIRQQHRR